MQKNFNPWDIGPTELIQFALDKIHGGTDCDKRLAFLVLDVGVETLFKTFLTIPENYSHAQTSAAKRREAVNGNFHDLIRGVWEAIPERTKRFNIEHIQYYHGVRNTLYHQGNTVAAVRMDQLSAYAEMAVDLLRELLGVDLSEKLAPPEPVYNPRPVITTGPDPVVDSVEVDLRSGRYRLERLRSQTIQIVSLANSAQVSPVKPFLREIIQELSLPIDLNLKSGGEKNTRVLGKDVIDELKPSAWHGLVQGQKVRRDTLVSMLTGRILEGKADSRNWDIVTKVRNLDQEELIFQPVGRGFGNSPFNLNCWFTENGEPIKKD
jgi:hypothetical protein